jgi:MerR family transcriptional regulator, light-induced transcriptional regulator
MPTDLETLTVGAAARSLGIAAPTLRSWERRYGLGPSARSAGGHRRYSAHDLARLRAMLQLVNRGVPTAAAADAVRERVFPATTEQITLGGVTSATSVAETAGIATAGGPEEGGRPVAWSGAEVAASGLPVRRSWERRRGTPGEVKDLFSLANAMEADRLTHEVARNLDRFGVVEGWTTRLAPLLIEVGHQWERTGECVEIEHLASDAVAGGLRYHTRRAVERFPPDQSMRPVVLACLEGENHALPLLAVAAALAERAVRVRTLGAATPAISLSAAVRRIRPAAVFIWSSAPETADLTALKGLAHTRPSYSLVVGGPGWQAMGTLDNWVGSLGDAVDALIHAVRA